MTIWPKQKVNWSQLVTKWSNSFWKKKAENTGNDKSLLFHIKNHQPPVYEDWSQLVTAPQATYETSKEREIRFELKLKSASAKKKHISRPSPTKLWGGRGGEWTFRGGKTLSLLAKRRGQAKLFGAFRSREKFPGQTEKSRLSAVSLFFAPF